METNETVKLLTQRQIVDLYEGRPVELAPGVPYGTIQSIEFRGHTEKEYQTILHVKLDKKKAVEKYAFGTFHQQVVRKWANLTQAQQTMSKLLPGFNRYWINPFRSNAEAPTWKGAAPKGSPKTKKD